MERYLIIPPSPEQEDYVIEHLQTGKEFVVHHGERTWIANHVHKQFANSVRIKSADFDIQQGKWTVVVVTHEN
jgi:hypothetical protein